MDVRVKAAMLSVASNTILTLFKLIVGLMINSVSVLAEAMHSGIDLIASFMDFFAVRQSTKPPDDRHRYGHGKIENVAGTIEAILIFIAAIWIIVEAYHKLQQGGGVPEVGIGLLIMGISAVQNFFVSSYMMRTAKNTGSIAVEADAMHLRVDVYTSAGVFFGLLLMKFTGISWLDPIVAIGVALLIIKAAFDLTMKAFMPLIDVNLSAEEEKIILETLGDYAQSYVEFHKLRTRRAGSERYVDLHLVVPRDRLVQEVHDLCEEIELEIERRLPSTYVLIHVEPCNDNNCSLCKDCSRVAVK